MSHVRDLSLTIFGAVLIGAGVYSHVHLNGAGEKVTLVLIALGGILIDYQKVAEFVRAVLPKGPGA